MIEQDDGCEQCCKCENRLYDNGRVKSYIFEYIHTLIEP
jgi:hypothetical protein